MYIDSSTLVLAQLLMTTMSWFVWTLQYCFIHNNPYYDCIPNSTNVTSLLRKKNRDNEHHQSYMDCVFVSP